MPVNLLRPVLLLCVLCFLTFIDSSNLKNCIVPDRAVIRSEEVRGDYSKEPGNLKKLFQKAADKGKRVIGIRSSIGNTYINATEIARCGISPILVFVNRKAGGKVGAILIDTLRSMLSDVQICDVTSARPGEYLALFEGCKKSMRVICCGGDGTVSW